MRGLDSLAQAGVSVKYVILDDGWQSTALSDSGGGVGKGSGSSGGGKGTGGGGGKGTGGGDGKDSGGKDTSSGVGVGGSGSGFASSSSGHGSDGELSGAQIDGSLAATKMVDARDSPLLQWATGCVSNFYTTMVEPGRLMRPTNQISALVRVLT